MENPSYYAIIPANVRYAPITPNAKLLYGEITALASKTGTCWATNGYFANLYGTSIRTVQRWFGELLDGGFIVMCEAPSGARGVRLLVPGARDDKNVMPPDITVMATHDKNVTHNNTSLNTTTSHKTNEPKASPRANPGRSIASALEDLETIPAELGDRAVAFHGLSVDAVSDEWAKFRNHHISARSKHTRVDLCWDTWCRNAAKWARGSKAVTGGKAGQGGYQRHDHVAAAVNSAMVDLYGVPYTGHGGQGAQPADETCPFPDGAEAIDAVFVDAGAGNAAREASAGDIDGSRADSVAGSPLPLEIVSG